MMRNYKLIGCEIVNDPLIRPLVLEIVPVQTDNGLIVNLKAHLFFQY